MKNLDKIPNLVLKKYQRDLYEFISIEGTISLNPWNDFQNKQDPYCSIKSTGIVHRIIRLDIGGDMILDAPQITDGHVNAYQYTLENSEIVQQRILLAVLDKYKHFIDSIVRKDEADDGAKPGIISFNELKNLISLNCVHLMNVEKESMAYVGYEFSCAWNNGHGLGIMTYRDRICKVGTADISFLTWVAEEDLETNEGEIIDLV